MQYGTFYLITQRFLPSANCLIHFVPFEKEMDSSFANVDLEIACQKKQSNKVESNVIQFRKLVLDIEQSIQHIYLHY